VPRRLLSVFWNTTPAPFRALGGATAARSLGGRLSWSVSCAGLAQDEGHGRVPRGPGPAFVAQKSTGAGRVGAASSSTPVRRLDDVGGRSGGDVAWRASVQATQSWFKTQRFARAAGANVPGPIASLRPGRRARSWRSVKIRSFAARRDSAVSILAGAHGPRIAGPRYQRAHLCS